VRKVPHVCAGGRQRHRRSRDTVRSDTPMPNLRNSRWTRRAPGKKDSPRPSGRGRSRMGAAVVGRRGRVLELRQQWSVLRRTVMPPHPRTSERLFWVLLTKAWQNWRTALNVVRPELRVKSNGGGVICDANARPCPGSRVRWFGVHDRRSDFRLRRRRNSAGLGVPTPISNGRRGGTAPIAAETIRETKLKQLLAG
jgi:hypothetical protein